MYYANKYNSTLTGGYTVGQTVLNVGSVPDNVPTLIVAAKGTIKETIFIVIGKTTNTLTGVTRLRGANVDLDSSTPLTCLNLVEFINQFSVSATGKATGADINAHIDDTKFVTSKAIADSYLANLVNSYNSLYSQALINGNFDVWQNGITFNKSSIDWYSADMWEYYRASATLNIDVTQQDGTGVSGSDYCARVQRTVATSSANALYFGQALESANSKLFRGKLLTLSFYARSGANFSAASGVLISTIKTGTGTNQNLHGGFTGSADVSQNNTLTSSWQRFTMTLPAVIGNTITQIGALFSFTPVGTAGAADYFEIAQVQLCAGDAALSFMPKSYGEEKMDCLRFYEKSYIDGVAPGTVTDYGCMSHMSPGSTSYYTTTINYLPKRVAPTVTLYSTATGTVGNVRNTSGIPADLTAISARIGDTACMMQINNHLTSAADLLQFHWVCDARF